MLDHSQVTGNLDAQYNLGRRGDTEELPVVDLPLPVLVHVVDDLVALFDDGDQLGHQLLLPALVLLSPVFLWETKGS